MARKTEEKKVEKPAVVRAEKARPKAKAGKWTAAEKAGAIKREAQNSAAKAKDAAVAKEAAKRQAAKHEEAELQAAKAKEEAARQAREAEAARRAEQSSAAKCKATEAKKAAAAQEDAKLKAPKAEAGAIANATLKAYAQAVTQQLEAQPTPPKKPMKIRNGSRFCEFPWGLSKVEKRESAL